MNWEETIRHIWTQEQFSQLVHDAYFGPDLADNITRFRESEEFRETLQEIEALAGKGPHRILDVGCGNGISSIAFALEGHTVTGIDPDPSEIVGIGAARQMAEHFAVAERCHFFEGTSEDYKEQDASFDIVYARQAMHHARELSYFVAVPAGKLRSGGLFVTVRDHALYKESELETFLNHHPLHKFYGGEHAFTLDQYRRAFADARLTIKKEYGHYDSVINYSPLSKAKRERMVQEEADKIKASLRSKIPVLGGTALAYQVYTRLRFDPRQLENERNIPGRNYSFFAIKS